MSYKYVSFVIMLVTNTENSHLEHEVRLINRNIFQHQFVTEQPKVEA